MNTSCGDPDCFVCRTHRWVQSMTPTCLLTTNAAWWLFSTPEPFEPRTPMIRWSEIPDPASFTPTSAFDGAADSYIPWLTSDTSWYVSDEAAHFFESQDPDVIAAETTAAVDSPASVSVGPRRKRTWEEFCAEVDELTEIQRRKHE